MHYVNPLPAIVIEYLDAVRLTGDPARLHTAPAADLVSGAAACAKAKVRVAEATGYFEQRARAFHVLDRAGRLLGRELRRREPNKDR
jgi:hypothetical protein